MQAGPPNVSSVEASGARPFWSVMIPTYNCADYLRLTLASVLEQDPGPDQMQIEIVDDCSTKDDPGAVVNELTNGRAKFYRQPQNVGPTENFNTCVRRSTGHVVHILHGDDTVQPCFYEHLRNGLEQRPDAGAAFCRFVFIDEHNQWQRLSQIEQPTEGVIENWIAKIAIRNRIQTPSIVVRRTTYEQLGGYHPQLNHSADWEMWRRIASRYPCWYEPKLLACYRKHTASHTSELLRSGGNLLDTRRSIEIARAYLPVETAADLTRRARWACALFGLRSARQFLQRKDARGAIAQIREAIKCDHSPSTLASLVGLVCWAVQKSIRRFLPSIIRQEKKNT